MSIPATCRWGDDGIHDVSTWDSRISPKAGWGTMPMCPNSDVLGKADFFVHHEIMDYSIAHNCQLKNLFMTRRLHDPTLQSSLGRMKIHPCLQIHTHTHTHTKHPARSMPQLPNHLFLPELFNIYFT